MTPERRGVALLSGAALLLALNDHLIKPSGLWPAGAGKLSDVAGLIAAPAALAAALRMAGLSVRAAAAWATALVGGVFCALQLQPAFAAGFDALYARGAHWLGFATVASVSDAADLLALPALALGHRLALAIPVVREASARLAVCASALACSATSVSTVLVDPHWGFPDRNGFNAVQPFPGGGLAARIGKQSLEGSFEVGFVLHAWTSAVTLDPAEAVAELAGVRAIPPAPCRAGAISAEPGRSASTRTCFIASTRDPQKRREQPPVLGALRVLVRIDGRSQIVRFPLEFRARKHPHPVYWKVW